MFKNRENSGRTVSHCIKSCKFIQKEVLDSLLRRGFCIREYILALQSPRIPDFNGISESESLIAESKGMDSNSRFNNHKSGEFWNPDCVLNCTTIILC